MPLTPFPRPRTERELSALGTPFPRVRNTAMDTELSPFGHHVETTEHHLGKTDKELVVIVIYKAGIYEEFIMSGA